MYAIAPKVSPAAPAIEETTTATGPTIAKADGVCPGEQLQRNGRERRRNLSAKARPHKQSIRSKTRGDSPQPNVPRHKPNPGSPPYLGLSKTVAIEQRPVAKKPVRASKTPAGTDSETTSTRKATKSSHVGTKVTAGTSSASKFREDCKDVLQDIFTAIWNSTATFSTPAVSLRLYNSGSSTIEILDTIEDNELTHSLGTVLWTVGQMLLARSIEKDIADSMESGLSASRASIKTISEMSQHLQRRQLIRGLPPINDPGGAARAMKLVFLPQRRFVGKLTLLGLMLIASDACSTIGD